MYQSATSLLHLSSWLHDAIKPPKTMKIYPFLFFKIGFRIRGRPNFIGSHRPRKKVDPIRFLLTSNPIKFNPIKFFKFSIRPGFENLRSDQVFKINDPIKFDPIRFWKFPIWSTSIRSGFRISNLCKTMYFRVSSESEII